MEQIVTDIQNFENEVLYAFAYWKNYGKLPEPYHTRQLFTEISQGVII